MREIKFRAWDKKRKEIRPVYSINNLDENDDYEFKYVVSNQTIDGQGIIDWIDLELMQYTGLKDKNGREIYEGDVVRILYTDWASQTDYSISHEEYLNSISLIGFVEFKDCEFHINFGKNKYGSDSIGSFDQGAHGIAPEVIGNIYENPELLTNS